MLETTILIAGGIALGGIRIALRQRRNRTPVWLTQTDGSRVKSYAIIEEPDTTVEHLARQINRDYAVSTVSLGLSVAGVLIFTPLLLVELPFNIYTLSSIIDQAYDGVALQRQTARLAALGVAAAIVIFSSQFITITFIQWVYFAYRKVIFDMGRPLVADRAAPA